MNYYDTVMAVIPASFIMSMALIHAITSSLTFSVAISATLTVLVVAHALFINPPVDIPETTLDGGSKIQ